MRQGLDKYSHRNGTVIKHKKDDFRVPELRFPNFRICDFEPQEYSQEHLAVKGFFEWGCTEMYILFISQKNDISQKRKKVKD